MPDKILCKTYLKEALGGMNDDGLMLLVSPELEPKAKTIVGELGLKLRVEPCERFPARFWIIF